MIVLDAGQGKVGLVGFAAEGEIIYARASRVSICRAWSGPACQPMKLTRSRERDKLLVVYGSKPHCVGVDDEGWTWHFDLLGEEPPKKLFPRRFSLATHLFVEPQGEFVCLTEPAAWNMQTIHRWDVKRQRELDPLIFSGEGQPVMSLSADGEILATGGTDRRVRLWKVRDVKPRPNLAKKYGFVANVFETFIEPFIEAIRQQRGPGNPPEHLLDELRCSAVVKALAFTPDQNCLILGAGWRLHIWRFDDEGGGGRLALSIKSPIGPVRCLACSPDGRNVAIGFRGGTVEVRDVETGHIRQTYQWEIGDINAIAYSPDGLRLAAGGKRFVVVWDAE